MPESFYEFTEKLGALYEGLGALGNAELQKAVLKLIDDVYAKLLKTDKNNKESEDDIPGPPQSLLCGEKEHPRNGESFDACGKNDEWSVM